MSHYNVNVSVPKTLIQHLIRWVILSNQFDKETNKILQSILETEISPELVPHTEGDSTEPVQKTADKIGPYDLQDFNLYYITRFGFRPSKVAFLSHHAWSNETRGAWPDLLPTERRRAYDIPTIKKGSESFCGACQNQPIQEKLHPQRPQSRQRRLPLAPRRLASPQRQRSHRLARRTKTQRAVVR